MTIRIDSRPDRRLVWLHIAATEAMAPRGLMYFVRRLNRFLKGSGLVALSLLIGLKAPITAQDTGLVMLWLWRQPQVAALGIEAPVPEEVQTIARLAHDAR
jgi:hypothetical protein